MNNNDTISQMKKYILKVCLFALFTVVWTGGPAQAQNSGELTVHGTVSDDKEPLIGATVLVKNTQKGTATDLDGNFTIQASENDVLIFSYLGYKTQEIAINGRTNIPVVMVEDGVAIDELVVIGYGTVKKPDLTGSVSVVKMDDIADIPVLSVDQALQGRIAGADIMSISGEPGATTSIRIRGTRSISATNEPLIVVDGVMDAVSDLADINTADIASVSILKDASSTAIYGVRGSNGVIIITTKRGETEKPSISFRGDMGFAQLPRKLDIMNAAEFAQYRNDYALFVSGQSDLGINSPLSDYPYKRPWELGEGTDWVDVISRTAPYQNYVLSLSGKSKQSNYYASLTYNDQQGIIDKSGAKRYTGQLNIEHELFPWMTIGYKYNYTYRDEHPNLAEIGGQRYYQAAIFLSPLQDPHSDGESFFAETVKRNFPRDILDQSVSNVKKLSSRNTGSVEIKLHKNLSLRSQLNYYTYQAHTYRYSPGTLPREASAGEGGTAYRAESDEWSLLSETTLNYMTLLNKKHSINGLMGFTGNKSSMNSFWLQGSGYQSDKLQWNNMGAIPDKQNYSAATSYSNKAGMSVLARLNYDYDKRYYLTLTGRYDGASNFAENKKWALFPSAALKWSISNEAFMKDIRWIYETSLRLSAGRTGNSGISAYRSINALTATTGGYIFDGAQPAAFYPLRLASPDLTWEKTEMYNAALDMAFLKNRINMTLEAYLSYTSDLLLEVQTPSHTGYTSRFVNVGKTSNKGIELSIDTRNIHTKKFEWTSSFTISHNEQMVEDIGSNDFIDLYKSASQAGNSYRMYGYVKGYPLNSLWGFKYAGVWKNEEEVARNVLTRTYVSVSGRTRPGYARYADINHDGVLDQQDLIYLGNADPWLYGGLQNNFVYRNFTLSAFFNYSLGGKIYNISEQYMGNGFANSNQYRYMANNWHPIRNPDSDLPRAGTSDGLTSDRMVYDATFLRLKNISLAYNLKMNKSMLREYIRDIRFSLSGENLYLWKKYNGFDPDVSSESANSGLRRVDNGAYPKPRTVIFSIQIRY